MTEEGRRRSNPRSNGIDTISKAFGAGGLKLYPLPSSSGPGLIVALVDVVDVVGSPPLGPPSCPAPSSAVWSGTEAGSSGPVDVVDTRGTNGINRLYDNIITKRHQMDMTSEPISFRASCLIRQPQHPLRSCRRQWSSAKAAASWWGRGSWMERWWAGSWWKGSYGSSS